MSGTLKVIETFLQGRVTIGVGDIARQVVDAIVNAANSTLLGGGGVDGAIHCAGGSQILEDCKEVRLTKYPNGLPTGEAVITRGGNLPARYVIHTVGPINGACEGREAELLAASYWNTLAIAVENEIKTIAFPSISTGAFAYPREEAAVVSSETIERFLRRDESLEEVRLVFHTERDAWMFINNHRLVGK